MRATVPHHKGTGVVPLVAALKAHPRGPQAVPAALLHYLSDHLVPTAWYSERDFNILLQSLAGVLQKDGVKDVWTYFGRVGAQRDLKGTQDLVPASRHVKTLGIYRPFASGDAISADTAFLRLSKLWTLYHDTGRLTAGRSASEDCCAIVRLVDYHLPTPDLLQMKTAYFCEYLRIMGTEVEPSIVRATCRGDQYNEWLCRCERKPDVIESLALLPLLSP